MMFWIAFAVAVLVYGVIAYLSSKNWQIGHVILFFFVAIATVGAMVLGAMVLRTHREWRSVYTSGKQQLEQLQAEIERLERGSVLAPGDDFQDIPTLKADLSRALIDRGRVWRGVTPVQMAEGVITLNMQGWGDQSCARAGLESDDESVDAAGEEAAATPQPATPHGISQGMIVFAFAEVPPAEPRIANLYGDSPLPARDTKKVCRLPAIFLGRYQVADANDQTIQVKPVYPLSATQQEKINPETTWALYESMPQDRHDVFAGWTVEQFETVFLPPAGTDASEWQVRLTEWARDGQLAQASDPEVRQWVKIRFLQDTTIDVDAAAEAMTIDQSFDATGRATVIALLQGGPTDFKQGDELSLPLPAARVLIDKGSAELTDEAPVYRRPLRDFAQLMQSLQVAVNSEEQLHSVLSGDGQSIELSIQKAHDLAVARQQEQERLEEDLANFQVEKDVITKVASQLEKERATQRQTMSQLYQSNQGLRDSLTVHSPGATTIVHTGR